MKPPVLVVLTLVFCFSFADVKAYTYGVDISDYTSTSGLSCLVSNGYIFTIARIYESIGSLDYNGPKSMANAWAAGMSNVDGYIFPCFPCRNTKSAKYQANEAYAHLKTTNTKFGMLWIDVEIYKWGSCSDNVAFIQDMVDELKGQGVNVGIYTNYNNWQTVTCNSYNFKDLPLWYAHYDGNPSFSDFSPYGGWSEPAIKQYAGGVIECGISIDKNSY